MITEHRSEKANRRQRLSPLDEILQNDLSEFLGAENDQGCLVPIPAPTGIGKTHSIKIAILEELINSRHSDPSNQRTIYYITNSVDNVRHTYEELLQLIDSQHINGEPGLSEQEKALLKKRIVYLPGQDTQLLDTKEAVVEHVMNRFELYSDPRIRHCWQSLQKLRQSVAAHPSMKPGLQEVLKEKAAETYRLMLNRIHSLQRSEKGICLSVADYEALDQLVPGDRLQRNVANVCFMTTRKFLGGYQSLKSRIHPIRELNGTLLIIDEFDRQNEVILKYMAEQRAMDLIQITRTIHANLQQHELERSERYEGIEDIFDDLKKSLAEFAERWNIQFAFNTVGTTLETEKVRLFSDRTITHAHSAEHILRLRTDTKRRKNLIHSEPRDSDTELLKQLPNRLSRFVNEADWQYRRFIWTMRASVWRYLSNTASSLHLNTGQQSATYQEAVISILRHFNLQDLSNAVFAAFDAQVSFAGRRSKFLQSPSRIASRTYHDNGLKLTDVRRNEGTSDTVSCFYTGFTITPSGLMARLVESGAKVLGISATATSPTVIKNFDLDYLRKRLGSRFVELSDVQTAKISEYYHSRRRYNACSINVNARFLNVDRALVADELKTQFGKPVRKPAMVINNWLQLDQGREYTLKWVSKLLKALHHFINARHNRYMLVMLNRTIDSVRYPDFVQFLQRFLDNRNEHSSRSVRLFSGMNSQSMRLGEFNEVRSYLSQSSNKVVLLSTYASMGEGKNPDYPVMHHKDRKSLIWVGDGPEAENVKTDIDTLYLEKPSHQWLSDTDNHQVNQLLLCHQVMALQESNWISHREARHWIKKALLGSSHEQNLNSYHQTGDYIWLIRKIIEQAVGRTARTAFKRPNIELMADCDLREALASDPRPDEGLSIEYIALTQEAKALGDAHFVDRESTRMHNRAAFYTVDTLSLIKELMSGFRGADPESAIRDWESLRRQLLTEPTRATASGNCPRLYLQSPTLGGYLFSGSLETQTDAPGPNNELRFFDRAEKGRWVSEMESGLPELMRNVHVRKHFEEQGFATEWQPHPYIINPAAFFNLYKGALGEEGIRVILRHFGLQVSDLPNNTYENFDFLIRTSPEAPWIAVDAKHWRSEGTVDNHQQKAITMEQKVGARHFAYINLFDSQGSQCRFLSNEFRPTNQRESSVIEIPGVLGWATGSVIERHIITLLEWMGEHQ
ncbi:hypothetical protein [Vreelandella titanicae]|uniref:hypothetical protein n=1 Tax=Vreelandella titanicae TaxID=664683 RepID=UPI00168058C5|nr:hypothetical protein [Halomonas titanicae]QNU60656.1 hypothetical protein HZS52_12675 [Halomonas titanicae]